MSGPRGGARGPFNVLLRSPELADTVQRVGAHLRFNSSLPPRLNELAIIINARSWGSKYEWYAHRPLAIKAGLPDLLADEVAQGKRPTGMKADEEVVYDFCRPCTASISSATRCSSEGRPRSASRVSSTSSG